MKFTPETLNSELERIKNISNDDKSALAELMQDWAYSIAFIVEHEKNKDKKDYKDPIITKFGSVDNFKKYIDVLSKKLLDAGYNININNPKIKDYISTDKNANLSSSDESIINKTLDELPNMVLIKGFVKIVGSLVNGDKEPNDVDVYINASYDDVPDWLHKRISVMFEKEFQMPIDIVYNKWNGPLENFIDVYDLVLVKNIDKNDIYFSNPLNIEIIKPYKTFWNTITLDEIPFDNWVMQPKYNGMKVIITSDGKTYSENFNELPLDMSFIYKNKPTKNLLFIGEIWSKTLPRQTVVGNAKKGIFDKDMTITIYDSVDVRHQDESYDERMDYVYSFVKRTYIVPSYQSLSKMKDIMKHTYYDGVIIKDLDAPFISTKQMIKVKKQIDFDAKVLNVYKTKNGTYIYDVGFLNGNAIQNAGKTMATKDKFNVGDIIEIAPLEVTYYKSQNLLKIYVARIKGISNNDKPDSIEDVIKIADENGLLNIIE